MTFRSRTLQCFALMCLIGTAVTARADDATGTLAAWSRATIAPVLADDSRHSVHAYVNISPESPDGRWVLLYTSTTAEGHVGEVVVVERSSGRAVTLATGVNTEDIHRAACQQWICNGRRVVYHDFRNGRPVIVAVDVDSQEARVMAEGRLLGFGQASGDVVPIYGPHWQPGDYWNIELLNVAAGEIRSALSVEQLRATDGELMTRLFADQPVSLFFPLLSPDGRRVLFKFSSPNDGQFQSSRASTRKGLLIYEIDGGKRLSSFRSWGHPGWFPDSRRVLNWWEDRLVVIDSQTGNFHQVPNVPTVPGAHPTVSPDGTLAVTDLRIEGRREPWGVAVADLAGGGLVMVHRFDNSGGATSWRPSHPHPSFSPDGKRIYFNVSSGRWTRLFVAEVGN